MLKTSLFLLLLALASCLSARSAGADSLIRPARRVEVGLNITNTLTNVFSSSTNGITNDPYLLSLKFGQFDRRRWRMGLNFRVRTKEDSDISGTNIEEKETQANFRLGHEWVYPVSRRFAFYWGVDAVFDVDLSLIRNTFGFGSAELRSERWGYGGGPLLGVQWRVHPRVALTTESSIYAIYHSGFEEINAPPDVRRDPVSDFEWRPLIPSSLFVHIAF